MSATTATITIEPYLHFDGNARDALEFYRQTFGGEVDLMTFGQSPMAERFPEKADAVMHGRLASGTAVLMASDVPEGYARPQGFAIAIQTDDATEAQRLFAALSDGGAVTMPMQATFWSTHFGMLTDRFGIDWMINVPSAA